MSAMPRTMAGHAAADVQAIAERTTERDGWPDAVGWRPPSLPAAGMCTAVRAVLLGRLHGALDPTAVEVPDGWLTTVLEAVECLDASLGVDGWRLRRATPDWSRGCLALDLALSDDVLDEDADGALMYATAAIVGVAASTARLDPCLGVPGRLMRHPQSGFTRPMAPGTELAGWQPVECDGGW